MANHHTPQPIARVADDPTTRRLRELACPKGGGHEGTPSHTYCRGAFVLTAVARLAGAKAAWERAQGRGGRRRLPSWRGTWLLRTGSRRSSR